MKRSLHNFDVADDKDSLAGLIRRRLVPRKLTETEVNSSVGKKKILYVDNRSQYFVTHRLPLAMAVQDRLAAVHVTTLSRREEDLELIASKGLVFHKLAHNSNDRSVLRLLLLGVELAKLFGALK